MQTNNTLKKEEFKKYIFEKAIVALSSEENYKKFSIIVLKKITVHKNKAFVGVILSALKNIMTYKHSGIIHLSGLRLIKDIVSQENGYE